MHFLISECDEAGVEKLKKVEEENGLLLLAYKESEYDYDQVTDEDLAKIKAIEDELGVKILALKKK